MRIYDVTLPIHSGMPVYEGDPEVSIQKWLSLDGGGAANVSLLQMGSHTGTHVDAPLHFRSAAPGVDRLPLDVLIGPARVYALAAADHIDAISLQGMDFGACPRVLFKTRNSARWHEERSATDFVALAGDGARFLVEAGIQLIGLDGPSADPFSSTDFPAHHTLLNAGVVIVEGLDLSAVPPGDYDLLCLPLKIRGGDGAPARVVLRERASSLPPPPDETCQASGSSPGR
jgi:arylformamidase